MTAGKEKIMDRDQQAMSRRFTSSMWAIIGQAQEEPGSELNWQVWQARRLEAAGFLIVKQGKGRRCVTISLTPAGEEAVAAPMRARRRRT
jgi:hypothetical protein